MINIVFWSIIVFIMVRINFVNSFNLYILKLIENKYYVGITKNLPYRFSQHKKGVGSEWTKLYKPIDIIQTFETTDVFDEDKWTKIFMNKHGIENVRGGTYCKINLEEFQKKALELELRTANNLCFRCGMYGHYASKCKNKHLKF